MTRLAVRSRRRSNQRPLIPLRRVGEHAVRHETIAGAARSPGQAVLDDPEVIARQMRELGLPAQSPMAQTSGAAVSSRSLMRINPRGSRAAPAFSSLISWVFGLRPAATRMSLLCVPKIRFCNIGDEGRRGQPCYDDAEALNRPMEWGILVLRAMNARFIIMAYRPKFRHRCASPNTITWSIPSDRTDQSLDIRVLPWRSGSSRLVPNAHGTQPLPEDRAIRSPE